MYVEKNHKRAQQAITQIHMRVRPPIQPVLLEGNTKILATGSKRKFACHLCDDSIPRSGSRNLISKSKGRSPKTTKNRKGLFGTISVIGRYHKYHKKITQAEKFFFCFGHQRNLPDTVDVTTNHFRKGSPRLVSKHLGICARAQGLNF